MLLKIDTASSVPIFEQLVLQVKYAVARGAYRPGDRLPSVRQLALDTLVNPNTVAKAYRELEREDIVRTRRGLGIFVADGAEKACRRDGRETVEERLGDVVAGAAQAGMTRAEVERLARQFLDRAYPKDKPNHKRGKR